MTAQITSSAVLFYSPRKDERVRLEWLNRVERLFDKCGLGVTAFFAWGGAYSVDDCQSFREHGQEFRAAMQAGEVRSPGVYSHREDFQSLDDWSAYAGISSVTGEVYLGMDEHLIGLPELLIRANEIASGLFDIKYGFAYKMPLSQSPASYASGIRGTTLEQLREDLAARRNGVSVTPAHEAWTKELMGPRRHLTGDFAGVFSVNIISDAHIAKAHLGSQTIGKLTPLDGPLWLWELSDAEIEPAERLLSANGVLITGKARW